MKKLTSLLLISLIFAGAAACGKNDDNNISEITPEGNVTAGEKTTLKIAEICNDSYINDKILEFNRDIENYQIEEIDYYIEDDYYGTQALTKLNMNILSGNAPDIVIAFPQNIHTLQKRSYLADLYPLMENSNGVKKADFLPNVIESLEKDSKLHSLYFFWKIDTAAVRTSTYGYEYTDWTYSDAINAFNNLSEGKDFLYPEMNKYDIRHYFLDYIGRDCIDINNNTCNFSNTLPEVLDFLINVPEIEDRHKGNYTIGTVYDDTALICTEYLYGINSSATNYYADFNCQDTTYVGYPSNNGQGSHARIDLMGGIMKTSPNKEAAWELFNMILEPSYQAQVGLTSGVPVIDEAANYLAFETNEFKNGSIKQGFGLINDPSHMTDEAIEKYLDYVKNLKIEVFYDYQLDRIIWEECQDVIEGEKSIDECIEILNNRIGLYLSENS